MAPLANGSQEGSMEACMHMYKWQKKAMKAFGHVNQGLGHPPTSKVKAKGPSLIKKTRLSLSLLLFENGQPLSLPFWASPFSLASGHSLLSL